MAKILLVEDNEMNRDMLLRRLERRGYSVVMAVDGQQGVDMARSEQPDLILLDMSLPVIDGWEVESPRKRFAITETTGGYSCHPNGYCWPRPIKYLSEWFVSF